MMNSVYNSEEEQSGSVSDSEIFAESEDEQITHTTLPTHDFIADAKSVILEHQDINIDNALIINNIIQENLKDLKKKLECILIEVQEKYKANENIVANINTTIHHPRGRSHSFFFCGAPFFKNEQLFTAPQNPDYLYRKKKFNEYFPMDKSDQTVYWVAKDKLYLIQGVKEQILKFLVAKNKDSIRSIKSGTRNASKKKVAILADRSNLSKKPLAELFNMIEDKPFTIDWYTISTQDLDGRHSSNECMGIWNGYLMPTLNRNSWTSDEEENLVSLADAYNHQNWAAISNQMNGRSSYQCLVQYQTLLAEKSVLKNVKWTKEEDDYLLELIEKLRIGNLIPWSSVVEKMAGRTKHQVYYRYMFTLKPGIKKDKFTVKEDCILMAAVEEYGKNFHKFPNNLLPGRTLVQIRNRYNNVLKFVGKGKHWSREDDEQLVELCRKYGTSDWVSVSKEIQHHTRFSCRSRYQTIMNYLEKHPNSTLKDVPTKKRTFSTKVTVDNWMETIIKVKQNTLENKLSQAADKARQTRLGKLYFEYMKYCYNFEIKPICLSSKPATINNHVVCQILYNKICPKDYSIMVGVSIGAEINMEYNNYADRVNYNYVLPPSWCTTLTLRGLSIMLSNKYANTNDEKAVIPKYEKQDALNLFKKRLFALLYSTVLVSKLNFPTTPTNSEMVRKTVNIDSFVNINTTCNSIIATDNHCSLQSIESNATQKKFAYTLKTNEGNYQISLLEPIGVSSISNKRMLTDKTDVIDLNKTNTTKCHKRRKV